MVEEFSKLLKDKQQGFDLHESVRDSEGNERFLKVDRNETALRTEIQRMAVETANEVTGQTFHERVQWVDKQKKLGNKFVEDGKLDEALQEYTKCLCALDFGTCRGAKPTEEQQTMVDKDIKLSILNNMALCLNRQGHVERAIKMLDQVLEIDEFNTKAISRRLHYLFEAGMLEPLRKMIKIIKLAPARYSELVRSTAAKLEKQLQELDKKNSETAKKMFSKPIYHDKPAKAPAEEESDSDDGLSPEERERLEEAEYLAELSNFHWLVYPFFKTLESICDKICKCKTRARKINARVAAKREAEQL